MQYDQDFNIINAYILKQVLITLSDGTTLQGKVTNILPETNEVCLDDNAPISLSDVTDMETVEPVAYHTYADDPQKAFEIVPLKLFFGKEAFVPGTDFSILLYGEFGFSAACHLAFTDGKIRVKDARILSACHNIYASALSKTAYAYLLRDGSTVIGLLQLTDESISVQTASGELVPIDFSNVLDIIRLPLINDSVVVTRKDGSVVSGTVSAADHNLIVLFSDCVQMVKTADILSIRYKGVVSVGMAKLPNNTVRQIRLSLGVKDENFLCKLPYLRDPAQESLAAEGAVATFVPGVSNRGLIAKDVVVEQPVPMQREKEYYGVILTVDFTKENGIGYIGNRYVAKSCGKPVSGNTRFFRSQMNFELEYNKAFVVKYTATEDPGKKLRILNHMEVHQILDASRLGIIDVSDEGEVRTVPLFREAIDRFANRDVDVICTNGETYSGILSHYDDAGITVVKGLGEDAVSTDISFDEIDDILLVGTVTQFYPNGTGYVDNAFFFHINEMEQAIDAQYVRKGTQFIFNLRNARKGNFVDCGGIRILHEKELDVYVTGYQDKKYIVVDAERYGKSVRFMRHAYEVPYSSYNQFRDLANEDYHAIFTLVRKAGVMECAYIRTLTNQPKLRAGVVTAMDKTQNTVTIVPLELYRKSSQSTTYPLAMRSEAVYIANPDSYDYDILYTLSVQDREYAATITWVDQKSTHYKCYFGYLETWMPEKDHGFITPEQYYGLRRKPRNYGVYCRDRALVSPPSEEELTDTRYIYKVCYTLNIKSTQEKLPAQNVWFLEKLERQKPSAPAQPKEQPQEIPAAQAENPVDEPVEEPGVIPEAEPVVTPVAEPTPPPAPTTEDIDLTAAYPPEQTEDVTWQYGIVLAYSPRFDSVRIYRDFQNKKLLGVDAGFEPRLILDTPISEESIKIVNNCTGRIVTSKFSYLVRFAVTTGEDGSLCLDRRYPLEILREFRKNTLRSLCVEDTVLHLENSPILVPPAPTPAPTPAPAPAADPVCVPIPEGIIPYHPGETVLFRQDGVMQAGIVKEVEEDQILLADGQTLHSSDGDIIRFGVLTSFNEDMTVGYLNGNLPFSFANMESRTFNMIKTAKKQQLLWYTCQDGTVSHIERITGDFLEKLPFRWVYGTVTDYTEALDRRCILVDGNIRYLLTVATGVYIWGLIKSDSIIGKAVHVKVVTCPYTDQTGTQICQYAMDIHAVQEVSTIRYDAVSDNYLAAQNATQSVVVEGNRNVLSSLVDSQTTVLFRITEDGRKLQAYIDNTDGDAEWTEELPEEDLEVSKVLMDSGLVQYLLSKVDLAALQLPEDILLTPEGQPADQENAVRLILHLEKRFGKDFNVSKYISVISLMEQLPDELKEETLKQLESRAVDTVKQSGPRHRQEESLRQVANRYRSVESMLWWMLNRQVRILGLQNDCLWGEYSYYITTLLRDIHSLDRQKEEIYKLFLQDFYSRIEVMEFLRQLARNQKDRRKLNLQALFQRDLLAGNARDLVAHMVSLDETAIQHLVFTENIFSENPKLAEQVLARGREIDSAQNFDSVTFLIDHLRALYKADKLRYTKELANAASGLDTLKHAERILKNTSGRFLLLLTADDAQRFTALQEICEEVISNRPAGYRGYQAALANAWSKCSDLLQSAQTHLTQESTEMLLKTGLLEAVLGEIGSELNALYTNPDYVPNIRCTSNDSEVVPSQEKLILLVENGIPGHTNLQNAYNITLHLEVVSGLSADSIPEQVTLKDKLLSAGDNPVVLDDVALDLRTLDGDTFSISVTAEYEYCTGFENGEIREIKKADCGTLEFQLRSDQNIAKNADAINYYLHPAEGNPLKETSEDDCRMFFGREEELQNIWDSIVDDSKSLREGRAIMLYGQKKCGKTSLINQIIRRMREDEAISKQAIILSVKDILEFNGGVTGLKSFSLNFYQNILNMLKIELMLRHRDVRQMLMENGLEIPNLRNCPNFEAAEFQNFFLQFSALSQGRYRIVLVMDEFTRLCTTILSRQRQHPEYNGIPNFIKLFSSMGFVQIIIGHPNMMRALGELGIINHTAEFAKRIELSALKEADARALIREPMIRSFGFDVYQTVLGERAIKKLLDLSGCHPSVLMKLCDQMFQHYITTAHSQILIHDVEKMLNAYLPQLEASTTFDILVEEDGDPTAVFDNLPAYRYLKTVATESLRSNNRDCDINIVCKELKEEDGDDAQELSKDMRELLLSRRVLTAGNGRIKIPVELFLEYIRFKYKTH